MNIYVCVFIRLSIRSYIHIMNEQTGTPIASYYTIHNELMRQKRDPLSLPIHKKKCDVYNQYLMYYKNVHVDYIRDMIISTISARETSCIIYDQNTLDSRLHANDLEDVFNEGVGGGSPSIRSIFIDKLGTCDYTITCHRATQCKIIGDTTIIVQFVLHWTIPV